MIRPFSWCVQRAPLAAATALVVSVALGGVVSANPAEQLPSATITHDVTVGPGVVFQPGSALASDGQSVWVGDGFGVARIDGATGSVVLRATVGANGNVAVDGNQAWISSYSRDLVTPLDPATGVADQQRLTQVVEPTALALGFGSLWVGSWTRGSVTRIDTANGRVIGSISVPNDGPLVAGLGSVWVASTASGGLARVDPATLAVTTVKLALPTDTALTALTVGPDAVWAADSSTNIYGVDPHTSTVRTMSAAAGPGLDTGINGIAASATDVWATGSAFTGDINEFLTSPGTLVKVDPSTMTVVGSWKLDAAANGAALAGGNLWTAVGFSDLESIPATDTPPTSTPLAGAPLATPLAFHGAVPYESADGVLVPLDIYAPRDAQQAPVVVLVPGGPLGFGNRHYLAQLAAALADRGAVVLDIDYRSSATGDLEPDAQHDVACAIGWARDHAGEYGGDPGHVVAVGHSYGGYLLMRSLLAGPDAATCDGRRAAPDAVVSIGKIKVDEPVPAVAASNVPLTLVIGSLDDEYDLAKSFNDQLTNAGYRVSLVVGQGADHYSVIDGRETVPTLDAILSAASAR